MAKGWDNTISWTSCLSKPTQLPDPVQHELPALLAAGAGLWPGAEQEGSGPARSPVLVCSPVATATPRGMRSFVCKTLSLSGMERPMIDP